MNQRRPEQLIEKDVLDEGDQFENPFQQEQAIRRWDVICRTAK